MFSPCFPRFLYVSICISMFSVCYHHVYVVITLFSCCFHLLYPNLSLFPLCLPSFIFVFPPCCYLSISEKVRNRKFLEKSRKIYIRCFHVKWGREPPGMTQGALWHHTMCGCGLAPGRAWTWCGAPWPLTCSPTYHTFLFHDQTHPPCSNPCSCCSSSRILISLLSPSLLLRFGAFVL